MGPKRRYDICSAGQCERWSYFWIKKLNPFDPGLDLVRSQEISTNCSPVGCGGAIVSRLWGTVPPTPLDIGDSFPRFLMIRTTNRRPHDYQETPIKTIYHLFDFTLKVSASRMKNDFVHVAPSTGLTVCHSVTPIINDILDYLGANFTQNSRNIMSSTNIPFSRTFLTNLRIAPSSFIVFHTNYSHCNQAFHHAVQNHPVFILQSKHWGQALSHKAQSFSDFVKKFHGMEHFVQYGFLLVHRENENRELILVTLNAILYGLYFDDTLLSDTLMMLMIRNTFAILMLFHQDIPNILFFSIMDLADLVTRNDFALD
ncbi:hypothetical protein G5I_09966 [Acromyrmex echinatior]|uniref:Uncharacterized protein n=1 Tax=Acromyrmex echinatior TaxID=103372 RepID=F4WVM4_ACREC|nr:hypothetical protein G5I_09966 [Acromyrmex echinatior]